jgi:hypothetical protein
MGSRKPALSNVEGDLRVLLVALKGRVLQAGFLACELTSHRREPEASAPGKSQQRNVGFSPGGTFFVHCSEKPSVFRSLPNPGRIRAQALVTSRTLPICRLAGTNLLRDKRI